MAEYWQWLNEVVSDGVLSCSKLISGESRRRHDAVADAVSGVAWQVGAQVRREVDGLDPNSKQRPDLEIVDVVASHSLTAATVARGRSTALLWQGLKNKKYARIASRLGAELLDVSVDACGGMADDASRLVKALARKERDGVWERGAAAASNDNC